MNVTDEDVKLAERYAAALQSIKEHEGAWTEEDVETAERYLAVLQSIKEFKEEGDGR